MFVLKILSVLCTIQFLSAFDFDDLYDDGDIYYEDYYETTSDESDSEPSNRAKRYQDKSEAVKTLSPDEIREVKGAIKQLLPNMAAENPFTPYFAEPTKYLEEPNEISTPIYNNIQSTTSKTTPIVDTDTILTTQQFKAFARLTTEDHFKNTTNKKALKRTSPHPKPTRQHHNSEHTDLTVDFNILRQVFTTSETPLNTTDNFTTTDTNITTTTPARSKVPQLDIPRLMAIIADLASEFETNLTRKLNETLFNMSIPTCTTPTPEPPTTNEYDANYTGATIAKCFVCGLDVPQVPRHAHCADAFAGDFLPLVPVDPSAKGKISTFRKYCKYANIPNFRANITHPRNIYGRWTGGCAVRWIDLSGIYTQRTCRSRMQPSVGKHFASKRMAKLERTLWNIENGCIISPVATLVPLSRGISLYARFHACVCSGNWCNIASTNPQWTLCHLILSIICLTRLGQQEII